MPDLDLDIYEGAHQLAEVGAGIGVAPRVWAILQSLGLERALLEASGTTDSGTVPLRYLKGDQHESAEILEFTSPIRTFHRAHIQQVFMHHLKNPEQTLHFSKRLVRYAEPENLTAPIVLTFKDGTTASCDVLLGADGIKSPIRHQMYNELADAAEKRGDADGAAALRDVIPPVWSGMVAYRAVVPADKLTQDVKDLAKPMMNIFLGKWRYVVCFPISRGQAYNVAAMVETPGGEGTQYDGPWSAPSTAAEVLRHFPGWDPKIRSILSVTHDGPTDWAVKTLKELPTFVHGRVALLGDAAHAMTPSQGSGAGQAIEDGYVLAAVLAQPAVARATLAAALAVYDAVRRPFAQDVARRSRESTRLYHFQRLGWEDVSEDECARGGYSRVQLEPIGRTIEEEMRWVHSSRIEEEEERAVQTVRERLGALV
ncbi:FAD/NAD(P)-binding domain-containing protein [Epithele typhae]|uniref:FAD/NAD(P)-binding domain-containing protein n=1 Tax=Epithele typhae TaxID=378194 RepID=UPI0020089ACC|nr:FAD/NAD(P)-binding domain-containing protein [Epithele typhae]KAH9939007.1 FAD/NAD(P)-binding domain-containing protein [Epithele typhae]